MEAGLAGKVGRRCCRRLGSSPAVEECHTESPSSAFHGHGIPHAPAAPPFHTPSRRPCPCCPPASLSLPACLPPAAAAGWRPHDAALLCGCAAQRPRARPLLRNRPGGHQPAGGARAAGGAARRHRRHPHQVRGSLAQRTSWRAGTGMLLLCCHAARPPANTTVIGRPRCVSAPIASASKPCSITALTPRPLPLYPLPLALPAREWPIPEEHFDTDRGTLLRFVAERTAEVVREHGGGGSRQGEGQGGEQGPVAVGFCFSFPVEQTALDNGKVLGWTKVRQKAHRWRAT